jgi:hypothetical protein
VRRRAKLDASLWILLALVAVAVVVALGKDTSLPLRGLAASARLFRGVWIELALGFLLAGLLEVLLPQPAISRWLGPSAPRWASGRLGAGLIIPGGPYPSSAVANLFGRRSARLLIAGDTNVVSPIRMLTYEAPLPAGLTLARFILVCSSRRSWGSWVSGCSQCSWKNAIEHHGSRVRDLGPLLACPTPQRPSTLEACSLVLGGWGGGDGQREAGAQGRDQGVAQSGHAPDAFLSVLGEAALEDRVQCANLRGFAREAGGFVEDRGHGAGRVLAGRGSGGSGIRGP